VYARSPDQRMHKMKENAKKEIVIAESLEPTIFDILCFRATENRRSRFSVDNMASSSANNNRETVIQSSEATLGYLRCHSELVEVAAC